MKKKIIIMLLLCLCLVNIKQAYALEKNADGVYINQKNSVITESQYKILLKNFTDEQINHLSQNAVIALANDSVIINKKDTFSITTNTIQDNEVVNSITISASEEEAQLVAENSNLHVLEDQKIYDISQVPSLSYVPEGGHETYYETTSKKISLTYAHYIWDDNPVILVDVDWYKIPMIKKYDILAVRWDSAISTSNIISYSASQECYDSDDKLLTATYDINHENLKITTTGIGQIMNIFDDANSDIYLQMEIYLNIDVGTVYASYQHAKNSNITLARAKTYTLSSNGLGNVIYFSNSTTRGYYDGMEGVQATLY